MGLNWMHRGEELRAGIGYWQEEEEKEEKKRKKERRRRKMMTTAQQVRQQTILRRVLGDDPFDRGYRGCTPSNEDYERT